MVRGRSAGLAHPPMWALVTKWSAAVTDRTPGKKGCRAYGRAYDPLTLGPLLFLLVPLEVLLPSGLDLRACFEASQSLVSCSWQTPQRSDVLSFSASSKGVPASKKGKEDGVTQS